MIYYTADLHLGHSNVIKFDNRPFNSVEEMDRQLIENWNKRVTNKDEIYIVGDLVYRSEKPAEWYLERLTGKKYLIIGNHEKAILNNPKAIGYFEKIEKMMHVTDGRNQICLCHFPIIEWNGYYKGHYHIYGHIHGSINRAYLVMREEPRALNAGCMLNHYTPATFNELIANNNMHRVYIDNNGKVHPRQTREGSIHR